MPVCRRKNTFDHRQKKAPQPTFALIEGQCKIVSEETRDWAISRLETLQATGSISHLGDAKNAPMAIWLICLF